MMNTIAFHAVNNYFLFAINIKVLLVHYDVFLLVLTMKCLPQTVKELSTPLVRLWMLEPLGSR